MRLAIALLKGFLFFTLTLVMAPVQILIMVFHHGEKAYILPLFWQKIICAVFGIKVIVEGSPLSNQQTLFVCNHISYLDIPVIGSVLRASFIAKKDVAGWPVFGFLSRLQQTAFISRSRGDAKKEKNALSSMIAEGKSLILFAEGTSTDGRSVAPFKSSLFSLTLDDGQRPLMIQPVTLRIERVDGGSPDDQATRNLYAWYGDMTMPPHLKGFAKSRGAVIRLIFHSPIDPKSYANRKILADACRTAVQAGLTPETSPIASEQAA